MKILLLPADTAGCGYYRMLWAGLHLQTLGHDIDIWWPTKGRGIEIKLEDEEIIDCSVPGDADVLVMQRVSHRWHSQVIKLLRAKGIAIVVDMDDDLNQIHRLNSAYLNYHPRSNTPYSWKNAAQACKDATLVTLSTKTLVNVYARHGRGVVIDNYVPASYLETPEQHEEIFGWAGTTQSHPADLQVTGSAVRELVDEGYKFEVIGPPSTVQQALRLKEAPAVTGIVPLEDWPQALSRLKVSMAPLELSPFNSSKSRLKAIEASACGVPWVASPRTEYRRLFAESGAGILADTPKAWYKAIKQLMDDDAMRKDLGERGREYMQTQTIEANSWRFLEAWTKAYEMQQADRG
jgi:glycosyltransferase involved in cell wall biosynthesis